MKKLTISVGIPAYQSEKNIGQLLKSLLSQKESKIIIEKILIYVDASVDQTVKSVKTIRSPKIKLYVGKVNMGYAASLQFLINKSKSDIFVALNDDIMIPSNDTIEQLASPFFSKSNIGMVGGNTIALSPKNFIGKCIYASYLVFHLLKLNYRNGDSRFSVDGKIFAINKSLANLLTLDRSETGNTDIFIYFVCKSKGFEYAFAKAATVLFRLPETIEDFKNQELRARDTYMVLKKQFGKMADEEWAPPVKEYALYMLMVILKYPIHSLVFKVLKFSLPKAKNASFRTWNLAKSTKNL